MKVTFLRKARTELIEAAQYYDDQMPGLGNEFLRAFDQAANVILDGPGRFGIIEGNVHCYLMHRFPYNVLYRVFPNRVQIVAVAHQRRRPGYWRGRIEQ